MKIEFKNTKTFQGREGVGLNADVYVDSKKCCFVMDDANGGPYHYTVYDQNSFDKLQEYVKSLPKRSFSTDSGKVIQYDMDLDILISEEYDKIRLQKEKAKLAKKFINHIVWGKPDGNSYKQVKLSIPLANCDKNKLQETINKYKTSFGEGEVFWNTNFEELGLQG